MLAKNLVGRNDMMLDKDVGGQKWIYTRRIQKGHQTTRAIFLVECEVTDHNRFGYLDGQWYKLEQAEYDAPEPKRRTFHDAIGSFTMLECKEDDPNMLFYMNGTHWKMGQ